MVEDGGMTDPVVRVDLPVAREAAARLGDEAYRLGHGLADVPGLTGPDSRWHTGRALTELESAVHTWFGALGGRLAEAATAVRTAADRYDAADQRAARRLPTPLR